MYELITENNTKFYVMKEREIKKTDSVFYNPAAKLSRDLTTLITETFRPKIIYDLNAGSGAMGLRLAKSINIDKIVFYDPNPNATKLVAKNAKKNNIENIEIREESCEYADIQNSDLTIIDPFGSPAKFYNKIIKNAKIGSMFGMKATDIGTVSGRYPKKAEKTYGIKISKTHIPREVSIRALLLFAEKTANKYNKSIKPIFSYATSYYSHIFFKIIEKRKAKIKYISFCEKCLECYIGDKKEICECGHKINSISVWGEEKSSTNFIKKMEQNFWKDLKLNHNNYDFKETFKELEKAKNQSLFIRAYDLHKFCKKHSLKLIKTKNIFDFGQSLPYDKETFTTWITPKELVKKIKDLQE